MALRIQDLQRPASPLTVDRRGQAYELRRSSDFKGLEFVQSRVTHSVPWSLHGVYYRKDEDAGNLIHCLRGEVFVVTVDLRRNSPTFGKYARSFVSELSRSPLWSPPGHGFGYLSTSAATVLIDSTRYSSPDQDLTVRWDDPTLNIPWPLMSDMKMKTPVISQADLAAPLWEAAP